jgi:ABC-type transport system involved in multi-copper enzyme maturation permease subunit
MPMFTALVIKEWREKALVFFFELGILVLLLGAQFFLQQKKDLRELLVYTVLLFFFPFAALVLGTAGFEAEYRQGAWAYLLSRPVARASIWLAKFAAVLSMFTALWLVFLAAWAASPAIREMAAGPRVFLREVAETGFPWWSVGLSLFLLVVAFSLSLLRARQFSLVFVALILGLLFPAVAWASIISKAGGFMALFAPTKALRTLLISLVLVALAFVGASLLTLLRSDFSQPRRQMATFARWFVPLLFLALAATAATALWLPVPGYHYLSFSFMDSGGDTAFYYTERGIFSYDRASRKIRWLTGSSYFPYPGRSLSRGRLAYVAYDIKSRRDAAPEIRVVNADGTGRKRILGRGSPSPWPVDGSIRDMIVSPDGGKIAILTFASPPGRSQRMIVTLWTVNADGSGLEEVYTESPESRAGYTTFVAWARERNALVIRNTFWKAPSKLIRNRLQLYDLDRRTMTKIQDDAMPASWRTSLSPRGDRLAIQYRETDSGPPTKLALLDLSTLEKTEVAESIQPAWFWVQWDPAGERMAFFTKRIGPGGEQNHVLAVYSLPAEITLAETVVAWDERAAGILWSSWAPDGRSLVIPGPEGRSLRILGQDLQDTGRIELPARIKKPGFSQLLRDQVLVEDTETDALWRLDLGTKRWKRLY